MVVPLLIYTGAFRRPEILVLAAGVLVLAVCRRSSRAAASPGRWRCRGLAPYVCTLYCSLTIVCACWAARGSILMPNRGP